MANGRAWIASLITRHRRAWWLVTLRRAVAALQGRMSSAGRIALGIALIATVASVGLTQTPGGLVVGAADQRGQTPIGSDTSASSAEGVPGSIVRGGSAASATTTLVPSSGSPQIQLGAAGEMIGFSGSDGSGTQTITLVHTRKSWMAVYHVERSGEIRLVSSRPLDADFSLQLNATSPLPEEIRALSNR